MIGELERNLKGWDKVWEELQRVWYPNDLFQPDEAACSYYEAKYAVAMRLQPRSILEIGVRAGYSAFTFLSAVPDAEYLGVDNGFCDVDEPGARYLDHARQILGERFKFITVWKVDSQKIIKLPSRFELVHVDGDHTVMGCLHDLELAAQEARWILVDDFDCSKDDAGAAFVRTACREFLLERPGEWTAEYLPNELVGSLLLTRQELKK